METTKTNEDTAIIFCIEGEEIIKITEGGEFYYKGKLVEEGKEIYRAMVRLLTKAGYYHSL